MRSRVAMMRKLLIAALAAVALSGPATGQAGWKEYSYPRDGFAARYPGEPTMTEQPYMTRFGPMVTERTYSFDSGGVVYTVAVADFGRARVNEGQAINEASTRLIGMGRLTHDVSARLNWNYGRELRVETADGTSYTDAIFLIDNKLFQLLVTYPARNSDPSGSAGIHYFQQAVRLLN